MAQPKREKFQPDDGPVTLYGFHAVRAALQNPSRRLIALHVSKNMADRLSDIEMPDKMPVDILSPRDLDKLVDKDAVHQGAVLITNPMDQPTLEEVRHHDLVLVLDQVTDPHNVGAIMRSASALGAGAIVTTRRNAPHESGVLAKTASGAFEHLPYIQVTNLARALEEINALSFLSIGLDSEGPQDLEDTLSNSAGIEKIALVLGAEGKGLRRLTRDLCGSLARLDMQGPIKSLNVSNASALSMYVCRRHLSKNA